MEEKVLNMLVALCQDNIVKEDRDVELFESGLIDSIEFAEMLVNIEESFDVIIAPSEMDRTELDTPNKLICVIKSKQD